MDAAASAPALRGREDLSRYRRGRDTRLRQKACRDDGTRRRADPPRAGARAAAGKGHSASLHHHPRGEESPDPADVRRLRAARQAPAARARAYAHAGRLTPRRMAQPDGAGAPCYKIKLTEAIL